MCTLPTDVAENSTETQIFTCKQPFSLQFSVSCHCFLVIYMSVSLFLLSSTAAQGTLPCSFTLDTADELSSKLVLDLKDRTTHLGDGPFPACKSNVKSQYGRPGIAN